MTIVDICIIVAVVVFLAATTYEYLVYKADDMYKRLYLREKRYAERIYKQLRETENKLKDLQNETSKDS